VLLLYGDAPNSLDALAEEVTAGHPKSVIASLYLPSDGREHFGFLDGITRVKIAVPGQKDEQALPTGTVVFGHPDAAGSTAKGGPLSHDGSLVVLRELRKDVQKFWDYWLAQASGDAHRAIYLASKAVGRWPNGMPLLPAQDREPPYDHTKLAISSFANDRRGVGCPLGSHIRRANPRDGLLNSSELSEAISANHAILRRGRNFGPAAPPEWYPQPLRSNLASGAAEDPAALRGLFFIGLCTDIRRQFEFVMQNWIMSPKFAGLYNETDPLFANGETPQDFTIQTDGFSQHYSGVGGWITPHGGGYYFLPGQNVLQRLAARRTPVR
jgi:deferrochelatase/peroxidase EfeB